MKVIHGWLSWAAAIGVASCAAPPAPVKVAPTPRIEEQPKTPRFDDDAEVKQCLTQITRGPGECAPKRLGACVNACGAGQLDACIVIGNHHPEHRCGMTLLDKSCSSGDIDACYALGKKHEDAKKNRSLDAMLNAYERACGGGHARACTRLGLRYKSSNRNRARLKFEEACKRSDGEGCFEAGKLNGGSKSTALYRQGCDLGHSGACVGFARATLNGVGTQRDEKLALVLFRQACQGSDAAAGEACWHVTVMSFSAGQITRNRAGNPIVLTAEQTKRLRRSCDRDFRKACRTLAFERYAAGHYKDAIKIATKQIDAGASEWLYRYARGMSFYDLGDFKEAATDLTMVCPHRADWPFCQLWLFLARERSGEDGDAALETALQPLTKGDWPEPVFRFYLGKLTERALMRLTKSKDAKKQKENECEAHYYIGGMNMVDGKVKRARARFEKSVATNITHFMELKAAKLELKRLAKASKKP